MSPHQSQEQIDAYLDEELHGANRDDFLAHCGYCETCRARLESRRTLLQVIRVARPRFQTPGNLRRSIATILDAAGASQRSSLVKWKNWLRPQAWSLPFRFRLAYAWLIPVFMSAGLVLYVSQRQARAGQFVDMAAETHHRQLTGSSSVEFRSTSAREVARWCSSRLSFAFRLPTYQDDSGDRSKYELIGASLVSFRGKEAAYIAYRMGTKQIGLIVVSADQVVASGGEITKAKSLIFHSMQRDGLEIFTWSVHNLTYALISDLSVRGQQSCVVCHADPRDRSWRHSALLHDTITNGVTRLRRCLGTSDCCESIFNKSRYCAMKADLSGWHLLQVPQNIDP